MHALLRRRSASAGLVVALSAIALFVARPAVANEASPYASPTELGHPSDERVVAEPAELQTGHVDLGPRFVDGRWELLIRDDTVVPSVWRSLNDVVLLVRDSARRPVPDDPAYSFVGVEPGRDVYVVPQVQEAGVVWLGWNTQEPEVLSRVDRGATLTLLGVQGPGEMTVFLQAGDLRPPDLLWRSGADQRQPLWVDVNSHTHANWVFSEPGIYLVQVELSAALIDGREVRDTGTLRFAVGDDAQPASARAETFTAPTAPPGPMEGRTGARAAPADEANDSGRSGRLLLGGVGLAVVVLILVGGVSVARSQSAKHRVEADRAAVRPAGADAFREVERS